MHTIRWETNQRYYVARVSQDLLGDWVIESSWGGLHNNLGNRKQQIAASYRDAIDALVKIHAKRRSRKYGIVASQ